RYLVFMLFFFFSFFSYFALLFLLSFPTRRSSDLLCEHSISYFSVHSLFLSISEHNLYYETFPVLSTVFGTYGSHHFVDKYTLQLDRKSTRLNSSHVSISYAVFCLKKKKINKTETL